MGSYPQPIVNMTTVAVKRSDSGVDISPRKIRYWVRDTESPIRILRTSVSLSDLAYVTTTVIMKTAMITNVNTNLRTVSDDNITGSGHSETTPRKTSCGVNFCGKTTTSDFQ